MSDKLYEHKPHPHVPRNVNLIYATEQAVAGFNRKLAVAITRGLGSMPCAYIFTILAIIGFPGFGATPVQYVQWVSQTFIQLTALSVLAVGQSILGRHQELQSDEQYRTTIKSAHEIDQIVQHMDAQDKAIQQILFLVAREQVSTVGKVVSKDMDASTPAPENITHT